MFIVISQELPELVSGLFPVDPEKRSITGHSMGGHGALICHLKNPGMYSIREIMRGTNYIICA